MRHQSYKQEHKEMVSEQHSDVKTQSIIVGQEATAVDDGRASKGWLETA